MPDTVSVHAVTGVGGEGAKEYGIHYRPVWSEQSDLVATIVEGNVGLPTVEDGERTGGKHCPGRDLIGRAIAVRVVEEPAAEINGVRARIVELDPLILFSGRAVAIPVNHAWSGQDFVEPHTA